MRKGEPLRVNIDVYCLTGGEKKMLIAYIFPKIAPMFQLPSIKGYVNY